MAELIIPKPAVAVVIALLSQRLSALNLSTFVSSKTPSPATGHEVLPSRFIRVTRTGGGMSNPVTDSARLLIECWSDDSASAEQLANTARAIIRAGVGQRVAGGFIRGVDTAVDDGPTDYPDPLVQSHDRYQFQVTVLVSTN
jgi:hypothetical protein